MAKEQEEILAGDDVLSKAEFWIKKNKKSLAIIGGSIIVIVGGFLAYKYLYVEKREAKAAEQLYNKAFFAYEKDSFRLAAQGDPVANSKGLVHVVKKYDDTYAGPIAQYMLGMSYLHLGTENQENYRQAIKMLGKVEFDEDEVMLQTQAIGAMGDAYLELGDLGKAVKQYEKAAKRKTNVLLTPYYLMKAAMVNEQLGNWSKALKHYNTIKNKYPDSDQAIDIDKYIGRAEHNV